MIRILAATLLVAVLVVAGRLLPIGEWTVALAEQLRATGAAGVALFIVIYVASAVALLPASVLTLAAGFAYGPIWGVAIASSASVIGATGAFLLGRTLLRQWAMRQAAASPVAEAIDAAVSAEGFKLVLLLRLSPLIPFNMLNYALSLSRVPLPTYVGASFVGMLPGTVLYVYLGSLAPAAAEIATAPGRAGAAATWLLAAGFLATLAFVVVATRAAKRALRSHLSGVVP